MLAMSVCMHVCRPQYAGERVPTLQEALALCKELDLIAFVEVKSNRLLVSIYLICTVALLYGAR